MSYFGFPDPSSADRYFLDVPATVPVPGLDCYQQPSVFPCRILEELSPNPLASCTEVGPWTFAGLVGSGETSSSDRAESGEAPRYLPSTPTVLDVPGGGTTWAAYSGVGANVVGNGGWSLLQERSLPVSSPLSSSESHQSLNFFSSNHPSSSSPDPFTPPPDGTMRFLEQTSTPGGTKSKANGSRGRNTSSSSSRGSRNSGILSVSERRARNKVASAKYRQKKNRKEAEMSVAIEILTERCNFLERQVKSLSRENEVLRGRGDNAGVEGFRKGSEEDGLKMLTEMGLCL